MHFRLIGGGLPDRLLALTFCAQGSISLQASTALRTLKRSLPARCKNLVSASASSHLRLLGIGLLRRIDGVFFAASADGGADAEAHVAMPLQPLQQHRAHCGRSREDAALQPACLFAVVQLQMRGDISRVRPPELLEYFILQRCSPMCWILCRQMDDPAEPA